MAAITQTEPFELKGQWWRPEGAELLEKFVAQPTRERVGFGEGFAVLQGERDQLEGSDLEHACRGPLRFDPDSGLRLSLLGSSEIAFPQDEEGFTVLGLTTNGVPCSLLDCFVTRSQNNLPSGFADREIFGHVFVRGAHVTSLSELALDRLLVRIPGLLEFLWAPVHAPDGKAHGGLGRDTAEEHTVQLDGAELAFSVGERRSRTTHVSTQEREAIAQITLKEPVGFEGWRERWIEPLVRLVTFATRQPTVPSALSARIALDSDRSAERRGGASERRHHIDVIQAQRHLRREPKIRWQRMLISHAALGDDFDAFIAGWWEVHERLAGAGDFLFGALNEPMSLEPQLVTLASVVEGYHRAFHGGLAVSRDEHDAITTRMLESIEDNDKRALYSRRLRYANQFVQQDRLLAVLRRAGQVVEPLGNKAGRLAEAVIATRNYFVHLEAKDERVLEGASLYEANQLLILALYCNLLRDLRVARERALAGVKRAYSGERFWQNLQKRGCAWPK